MKRIKVLIQGMHCASCASNIERSLRKIKGVKECVVSPVTNKAFVESEGKIDEGEIKKAVSRVGNYKVVDIDEG